MFFESRFQPPPVSPDYASCRALFLAGDVLKAKSQAEQLEKSGGPRSAHDFLLCADIARSYLQPTRYFSLIKLGTKRFPENVLLQLQWIRIRTYRRFHVNEFDELDRLQLPDESQQALLDSILATSYARAGLRKHARNRIERCKAIDYKKNALILYELSFAHNSIQETEQAIAYGELCVKLAPDWTFARLFLAEFLYTANRLVEADQLIKEIYESPMRDANIVFALGLQALSEARIPDAHRLLDELHLNWQPVLQNKLAYHSLAYTSMRLGDFEKARSLATSLDKKIQTAYQELSKASEHVLLPSRLVCQDSGLCVPTAFAIAAEICQKKIQTSTLLGRIPVDQITIQKLIEQSRTHGLESSPIALSIQSILACLREHIPLIGEVQGFFGSHVELIVGFDLGLRLFLIREPETWALQTISFDDLNERYAAAGMAAHAIFDPLQSTQSKIVQSQKSDAHQALLDLQVAIRSGDPEQARLAAGRIPTDRADLIFQRDLLGVHVLQTPEQFQQSMEKHIRNPGLPLPNRLRAMIMLSDRVMLRKTLPEIKKSSERFFILDFIRLLETQHNCNWPEMANACDRLLARMPGMESLWVHKAQAELEFGHLQKAEYFINIAKEIAPNSLWLQARERFLFPAQAYKSTSSQTVREQLKAHADQTEMLGELAGALRTENAGRQYEEAEQDHIRFAPRHPTGYLRLADWYLQQIRPDLAHTILSNGRLLVGIRELPRQEFEANYPSEKIEGLAAMQIESEFNKQTQGLDELDADSLVQLTLDDLGRPDASTPEKSTGLQELHRRHLQGKLEWQFAVTAIALRLYGWLTRQSEKISINRIQTLLGSELPGPTPLNLELFLEKCSNFYLPPEIATYLLKWLEPRLPAKPGAVLSYLIARMQEVSGNTEQALVWLNRSLESWPGFGEAAFRRGILQTHSGDLSEASECFQLCLQSLPGHLDARREWVQILQRLGENIAAIDQQNYLIEQHPLHFEEYQNLIRLLREQEDHTSIQETIDKARGNLPPESVAALQTAELIATHNPKKANQMIAEHPAMRERHPEIFHRGRITTANTDQELETFLDEGLRALPDDAYLLDHKGMQLSSKDRSEARRFYRTQLTRGILDNEMLGHYIELLPGEELKAMLRLVQRSPGEYQETMVQWLYEQLETLIMIPLRLDFMLESEKHFPELQHLKPEIIRDCIRLGKITDAMPRAQAFQADNLDFPLSNLLLAQCLLLTQSNDAFVYLERAHQIEPGPISNGLLGDYYRFQNDSEKAAQYYQLALQEHPYWIDAVAGLLAIGKVDSDLFNKLQDILQSGLGWGTPYFHIHAVELARTAKIALAPGWLQGATHRFHLIQNAEFWSEETRKLAHALYTWHKQKQNKSQINFYKKFMSGLAKFSNWPGTIWIPTK